jgi:hypothetical protein
MLPANSGNQGWEMTILGTVLLPPRQVPKDPLFAQSLKTRSDEIWSLYYRNNNIQLVNPANVITFQIPLMNVISIDLAFDQLDREFIVWELPGNQVWMYWYDPNLAAHTMTQIAAGNNPCCMIDERRDKMIPDSDVFIFYQVDDHVYYRLQRERYLIQHEIPHNHEDVVLETCGMGTNLRMTLRTASSDALIIMAGEKPVGVDNDQVGLPWGAIPWDEN